MTRPKIFLFSLLVISAAVFVAFAAAEMYLRVTQANIDLLELTGEKLRDTSPSFHPFASWAQTDAYAAYRAKPGTYPSTTAPKTVNHHGFISTPELSFPKPEGTLRIAFLGGSSTAGSGFNLADSETWPWQTVEILRQQFPGLQIDFINGGLGGYSSFESFGRLWSRIRFFSPDIVVVYHGWNEMYYWKRDRLDRIPSRHVQADGSWSVERPLPGQPLRIYDPLVLDPLMALSQATTRLRLRFSTPVAGEVGPITTQAPLVHDYDRRGLDIWRTHLRLFRATAEIIGAELFVAHQATLIVEDLPEEHRKRCLYRAHGFDHDAHVDGFKQLYRITEEEILASHIIKTNVLSGIPQLFRDHIHPTVAGARRIAEVVAQALAQSTPFQREPTSGRSE